MRNRILQFSPPLAVAALLATSTAYLQAAAPWCNATLLETRVTVSAVGDRITVPFTAQNGCRWTIASLPAWITRSPDAPGPNYTIPVPTAPDEVPSNADAAELVVAANPWPLRQANVVIAGRMFTVVQLGPADAVVPWQIGDVFVGAADWPHAVGALRGLYRPLGPSGAPVPQPGVTGGAVPDLFEAIGGITTGCMVDPTAAAVNGGDLWTTSWDEQFISRLSATTHEVVDSFNPIEELRLSQMSSSVGLPTAGELDEMQAIEQLVFDKDGNYFIGASTPPENNDVGLGHGYILKISQQKQLLGWWKVDAGSDITRNDGVGPAGSSYGAGGVDQFDLASDGHTIFYTSEDGYIRVFNTDTAQQLPDIPIQQLAAHGTKASASTNLPDENNDLTFTARLNGDPAIPITVSYDAPALPASGETVTVTGQAIVISLRGSAGVSTSTAAQVMSAVESSAAASALVSVALAKDNNGTGVVSAMPPLALTGGVDDAWTNFSTRAFALRLLPSGTAAGGDGSAGFLVAVSLHTVYRLDSQGHITDSFSIPADGGAYPFALNLTPDAQSFWTATTQNNPVAPSAHGNQVFNFHIATGKRSGPFRVKQGIYGLCVKREYTAAQNVCYPLNPDGTPTGSGPVTCQRAERCMRYYDPVLFPDGYVPGMGADGKPNAACYAPGEAALLLADRVNFVGDAISDLDLLAGNAGFTVKDVGGLPADLSFAGAIVNGNISWVACDSGFWSDGQVCATKPVTVTAISASGTTFTATFDWVLKFRNAPPTLRRPGTITLQTGQVLTGVSCSGLTPFQVMLGCAAEPIASDPNAATDNLAVFTSGLPAGLHLPGVTSYGIGWALPLTGTAPTTLGSEQGRFDVTITVCDAGGATRGTDGQPLLNVNNVPVACNENSDHTISTTFAIVINAPPVLTVASQVSPLGVALVNQPFCPVAPCGFSPNGNPLRYELVNSFTLPAGLLLDSQTGLVSGVPAVSVLNHPVSIRVTDTVNRLSDTESFTWSIRAPLTLSSVNQTTLINQTGTYTLNAAGTTGDTFTYTLDSTLPSWLSWFWNQQGSVGPTFTANPLAGDVGQVQVSVSATDSFGSRVTTQFTWTAIANTPPDCSAATVTPALLWPPNHKLVPFSIGNITDPDGDPVKITIASIWQNQPVNDTGDGNTGFDATGVGTSSGAVRAERTGNLRVPGDGRVYEVNFTASDGKTGGTCSGTVLVGVPHDQGQRTMPVPNGCRWNSVSGEQLGTCAWLNAPVLSLPNRTNAAGTVVNLQVTATDPDGTPLTYSATSLPPGLSMSSSGLITGTIGPVPAGGKSKKYTVTVSVNDGHGTVKATFTWTVTRP